MGQEPDVGEANMSQQGQWPPLWKPNHPQISCCTSLRGVGWGSGAATSGQDSPQGRLPGVVTQGTMCHHLKVKGFLRTLVPQ